tara:strand:+ start:246 stop:728 length:483 start_codon:yes stop_codon:yes gene_type:complete
VNQIFVIQPYFYNGSWVFDDSEVGLRREPFVSGIPEMIEGLVGHLPNAQNGFRLLFSTEPFPNYHTKIIRLEEEIGGYWYQADGTDQKGWLCPAMFKYFDDPPMHIYARADNLVPNASNSDSQSVTVTRDELDAFSNELDLGNLNALREMIKELESRFQS